MGISIRQAGPADLPAAAELFAMKDGRAHDVEHIADVVGGFEPDRALAWIAFDGARPVGMTMMLVRDLDVDGHDVHAGYWANLYIHPDYRQGLLYPRLTFAMTQALDVNGLAFLYAGIRRPEVARAHAKLGFVKLGDLVVRVKPLRPARFLVRYKRWPIPEPFARVPDFLYRGWLSVQRLRLTAGVDAYETSEEPSLEQFAALVRASLGTVRQVWTASRLRDRYPSDVDAPYAFTGVSRRSTLLAAAISRSVVHESGVRAGVLMDLAFRPGEERAGRAALAAAEQRAFRDGCDVMLHLDGLAETRPMLDAAGYRPSPERYSMLLWPRKAADHPALADLGRWRYAFGDHDAFVTDGKTR